MITNMDVDGMFIEPGIILIGKATKQPDGAWQCLGNYAGALVKLAVKIKLPKAIRRHIPWPT